jgi:hypothetical protein
MCCTTVILLYSAIVCYSQSPNDSVINQVVEWSNNQVIECLNDRMIKWLND